MACEPVPGPEDPSPKHAKAMTWHPRPQTRLKKAQLAQKLIQSIKKQTLSSPGVVRSPSETPKPSHARRSHPRPQEKRAICMWQVTGAAAARASLSPPEVEGACLTPDAVRSCLGSLLALGFLIDSYSNRSHVRPQGRRGSHRLRDCTQSTSCVQAAPLQGRHLTP